MLCEGGSVACLFLSKPVGTQSSGSLMVGLAGNFFRGGIVLCEGGA